MDKLGVGIVGCGWVAGEHIKAFTADGRAEVRALADADKAHAQNYKDKFNLNCKIHTDIDSLLAQDDVDIVVICTPNHLHAEQSIAVAQAKKHVVIEKPCAITLESLKAQHLAVKDNGVKSLVGFVLRFNPLLQAIDSVIEKGSLGNIFAVEVDYLHRIWMDRNEKWYANKDQSGTALLLAGCHAIDALRWFSRSEVQEVTAYHLNTENPLEFPGTISVNAKFADGKIGRSLTSFDLNMPYRFNIGVYGTRGAIRNDEMFLPDTFKGQNDFLKLPCALPDSGDVTHHPFTGQASYFIDSIINDTPVSIDMADAYKTHLVCMAADISAQQNGKPVKISDLL